MSEEENLDEELEKIQAKIEEIKKQKAEFEDEVDARADELLEKDKLEEAEKRGQLEALKAQLAVDEEAFARMKKDQRDKERMNEHWYRVHREGKPNT